MDYKFDEGDRVRILTGQYAGMTGNVHTRVPGNGTGNGWYSVEIDSWLVEGRTVYTDTLSGDELEAE